MSMDLGDTQVVLHPPPLLARIGIGVGMKKGQVPSVPLQLVDDLHPLAVRGWRAVVNVGKEWPVHDLVKSKSLQDT